MQLIRSLFLEPLVKMWILFKLSLLIHWGNFFLTVLFLWALWRYLTSFSIRIWWFIIINFIFLYQITVILLILLLLFFLVIRKWHIKIVIIENLCSRLIIHIIPMTISLYSTWVNTQNLNYYHQHSFYILQYLFHFNLSIILYNT